MKRLPILWIIGIYIFVAVISSISIYGIGLLINKSIPVIFIVILGVMFAGVVIWEQSRVNICQQSISIDAVNKVVTVVGDTPKAHIINFSTLRGYAINYHTAGVVLSLYPESGGIYTVALPLEYQDIESAINESFSGVLQVNYFDDLVWSKNT